MSLVIKSSRGFATRIEESGVTWSHEYPDAYLFTTKKEAKEAFKKLHPDDLNSSAEIILDYGLDSEEVVA